MLKRPLRPSPIVVAIARLAQHPALKAMPIRPVAPAPIECIVINRRFETQDENVHALLAISVFCSAFDRMEAIGDMVVDCLKDGDEPWSVGEARDVLFEKLGGDVTGFDEARQKYVRTIDFGVSW